MSCDRIKLRCSGLRTSEAAEVAMECPHLNERVKINLEKIKTIVNISVLQCSRKIMGKFYIMKLI